MRNSPHFETMGDDYWKAHGAAKWHKFAPAYCAIQWQSVMSARPDYYFNTNNAATRQAMEWWNQAIRFGFIDC